MRYAWYDLGPDEYGIEVTDEPVGPAEGGSVFGTFGEAKAALLQSLSATKYAYQQAINSVRALRKDEVG